MIELFTRSTRAREQKNEPDAKDSSAIDPFYGKLPRTSVGSLQLYVVTTSRQGRFSAPAHVDRNCKFAVRGDPAN